MTGTRTRPAPTGGGVGTNQYAVRGRAAMVGARTRQAAKRWTGPPTLPETAALSEATGPIHVASDPPTTLDRNGHVDHAGFAGWLQRVDPDGGWESFNDWSSDGYGLAICATEPVTDPTSLVAYFGRSRLGMGQDGFYGYQEPKPVNPDGPGRARVWLFDCDLTKSPSDDVGIALDELPDHLVNGSRIRTTDKAGPGTKGTRAVEGIGPCAIALR